MFANAKRRALAVVLSLAAVLLLFCGCGDISSGYDSYYSDGELPSLLASDSDQDASIETDKDQNTDLSSDPDSNENDGDIDLSTDPDQTQDNDQTQEDNQVQGSDQNDSQENNGSNLSDLSDMPDVPDIPDDIDLSDAPEFNTDDLPEPEDLIDEYGTYSSKEEVALYIHIYGHLPQNFITKSEARDLGWEGGSLERYAPGKCIGGDRFGNYEGLLPKKKGRVYTECDIDTLGARSRGAKRIVFSNDGLIYYTDDHYESFTLLYGEE